MDFHDNFSYNDFFCAILSLRDVITLSNYCVQIIQVFFQCVLKKMILISKDALCYDRSCCIHELFFVQFLVFDFDLLFINLPIDLILICLLSIYQKINNDLYFHQSSFGFNHLHILFNYHAKRFNNLHNT